jgi:dihydroorotate dehydrogenase (NAD+) catalytic subunit
MTDLTTKIGSLSLKNPLITASGTCGYGREMAELFDLSFLGGIAVKGTTLEPRPGNPTPRIAETPCGMLNSIGLQNPGVEAVISEELPFLQQYDTAVIVNIAGHSLEEYGLIAARLEQAREMIAAIEVNISCPNVKAGGMSFGIDCQCSSQVISLVRSKTSLPLIAKLTPNVTDITELAKACEAAGANALSLINTILGMAIDAEQRRPVLANRFGGLSGPAIKPIALRMVYQTAQAVSIPIIGGGGIMNSIDVIEFLLAGASAVQIGSVNFHNPYAAPQIIEGLHSWCEEHGIERISELIGALA